MGKSPTFVAPHFVSEQVEARFEFPRKQNGHCANERQGRKNEGTSERHVLQTSRSGRRKSGHAKQGEGGQNDEVNAGKQGDCNGDRSGSHNEEGSVWLFEVYWTPVTQVGRPRQGFMARPRSPPEPPMLDIRLFRETPDVVRKDLTKRGRDVAVVDEVIGLDEAWRDTLEQVNTLRARRNKTAKEISKEKGSPRGKELIVEMKQVSADITALEKQVEDAEARRDALLRRLPNLMHDEVPVGADDGENVTIRTWGECVPLSFEGKSHVDLLTDLDVADMERAARAAGARFYYLKNGLVRLSQALTQFALDRLGNKGYTPIQPPYMLRRESVEGATDLSDFEDVIYKIEDEDLYLIATSEHAIGALHMGEILNSQILPLRYAAVSPCFRKEAGAHGRDTRGIFRVHQFDKVEQFVFSDPAPPEGAPGHGTTSWDVHDELIANAEELFQALEIPYRVVDICTGDLGTVAARKYDIEAWMPVQQAFREVVSCSNCTDYQARRFDTRTRDAPGSPTRFVHTLNSTAIAVQRTLVAILENHQQPDGSVRIPEALQPYCGGLERMEPRDIELQG